MNFIEYLGGRFGMFVADQIMDIFSNKENTEYSEEIKRGLEFCNLRKLWLQENGYEFFKVSRFTRINTLSDHYLNKEIEINSPDKAFYSFFINRNTYELLILEHTSEEFQNFASKTNKTFQDFFLGTFYSAKMANIMYSKFDPQWYYRLNFSFCGFDNKFNREDPNSIIDFLKSNDIDTIYKSFIKTENKLFSENGLNYYTDLFILNYTTGSPDMKSDYDAKIIAQILGLNENFFISTIKNKLDKIGIKLIEESELHL